MSVYSVKRAAFAIWVKAGVSTIANLKVSVIVNYNTRSLKPKNGEPVAVGEHKMNTAERSSIGGHTGLGLLVLMAAALVAGELSAGSGSSNEGTSSPYEVSRPIMHTTPSLDAGESRRESIRGAIRELRILPAAIDERIDLNWSPDERLLEEYRRTGI